MYNRRKQVFVFQWYAENETNLSENMSMQHKHKECVAVASTEEVDNVQLRYVT